MHHLFNPGGCDNFELGEFICATRAREVLPSTLLRVEERRGGRGDRWRNIRGGECKSEGREKGNMGRMYRVGVTGTHQGTM